MTPTAQGTAGAGLIEVTGKNAMAKTEGGAR